ncbi:MAG: molybdate ABC transporter substrate-binding protein [Cellulosilyticaceae bacterium]
MRRQSALVMLLGLLVLLVGCNKPDTSTLYVLGASSLSEVLEDVAKAYLEEAPHIQIKFSFDGSGTLARQIEEGAPADVFISADLKQMNSLDEAQLMISESIIKLLSNQIVLIKPKGSALVITGFEEVVSDTVEMVAIGGKGVPVGDYTQQLYTQMGLWDEVTVRANFATSVRQVLDWVATGNVDCGIVYLTDALAEPGVEVVAIASPEATSEVVYPAGVVAATQLPEEAQDFVRFLSSQKARDIFRTYGFGLVGQ